MSTGMSPLQVLFTSLRAVATMGVMAAGGVYMNKKGVMTPQVSKGLSEISMSLTIPCLLFTTAIDCKQNWSHDACPRLADSLRSGWPMLLLPLLYVGSGLIVGWIAAYVGGAEANFRRSAMAAVTFGNSTGLPLTLLAVVHAQFSKKTDLGSVNPLLFLSVYLVLYPVLQWSVGAQLLRPKKKEEVIGSLLLEEEKQIQLLAPEGFVVVRSKDAPAETTPMELPVGGPAFSSAAENGGLTTPLQSDSCATQQRAEQAEAAAAAASFAARPTSPVQRASKRRRVLTGLKRVFPPPVMGALLGMVVALNDPVRNLFVDLTDRTGDAWLAWVFNGMQKLGAAAVPINMLILGNSLAKGAKKSPVSMRTAAAVAFAKMVVMPAIGLSVTLLSQAYFPVPQPIDDAFYLVAMIVSATPTANNIMVMAELAGESKEGLAACIFLQYLLAPVLLTGWLAVFVAVATRSHPHDDVTTASLGAGQWPPFLRIIDSVTW
eukprot:TRINITY_DN100787_c0_g1_i1.p1 TRINITY_DN100787_c0_g1~~TRINITY_DN100787_c0_g1_i1.p1  ORF type:complete len:489 (-),score=85.14 TRINITY_DN100787_c0_g1_i1:55-1521(-)